ncbi:MAG: ROK family protein [Anaerobacillus sp.]|uniref:ROK family protein n=1 Tax=Anaerobacillus sp. TaxID=1872506 RepID=UPI00391AB80C
MKKVIGIDVGGTGVKGSLVLENGEVLKAYKVATDITLGRQGILTSIFAVVDYLIESEEIIGIGIGTAGRVNVTTGEVVFATANLPGWQGVSLSNVLAERYQHPCVVENDANAALLGELWQGAATDPALTSVTMLTLGTGVGGANAIGRKIIHGGHFQGGEWGHVVFVPDGRSCNCGMNGCLEQYLSGTALVSMTNEATGMEFQHGQDIFATYQAGNETVAKIVDIYIDHLALAIYNISITLDPKAVIIGGGVIDSKAIWWPLLIEKLANYQVLMKVFPAQLGNRAGMLGAAKLAIDYVREGGN